MRTLRYTGCSLPRAPTRLAFVAAVLAIACLVPSARAVAQEQQKPLFRVVDPRQPTDSPGKIEVVEFFSYACPHCAHFYSLLDAWLARAPRDVRFRRVPVGFHRDEWINLQRTYYALQATGDLARLDGPLFNAIHGQDKLLFHEPAIAEWVGAHGGDASRFTAAYASFNVNNQTVQADTMAQRYGIDAVPTLAVGGEYIVLADDRLPEEDYQEQLLANTDKVIARVRAERAGASATGRSRRR